MREALLRVGREFPTARQDALTDHPLAHFIRTTLPADVREALGEFGPALTTEGSPGAGNWARVPWVAVFDPMVTDTATKGYYAVYLFAHGRPELHLSLNQGTTAVVNEFAGKARSVLRERAALMRSRLPDFAKQLDVYSLELGSKLPLPRGYEAGHAFGRRYSLSELPSEEQLRADLLLLTRAYLALTFRGGLEPSPEQATSTGDQAEHHDPATGKSLLEVRQYRMHRRIDRHPRASREAKEYHGTTCQGCGFEFRSRYGEIGRGYIEAHHLRPLGELQEGVPIRYEVAHDFAVLCSNCHRMIHRTDDPSDLTSFRALLR
jgi:5-methylcytosine-specific restriction enzyme A